MNEIPLRERKFAQTKLALLHALLARLGSQPLEEITIRELCQAVPVSEATFFNYFPKKTDMLVYFIQLWSIEVGWHARHAAAQGSWLSAIETLFDFTASQGEANPAVMREIIAFQARLSEPPSIGNISQAERLLAFPTLDRLEELPDQGLDSLLRQYLQAAVEQGELPANSDITTLLVALCSVFFGVPLVLCHQAPGSIGAQYRQQLQLLWAGARAQHR